MHDALRQRAVGCHGGVGDTDAAAVAKVTIADPRACLHAGAVVSAGTSYASHTVHVRVDCICSGSMYPTRRKMLVRTWLGARCASQPMFDGSSRCALGGTGCARADWLHSKATVASAATAAPMRLHRRAIEMCTYEGKRSASHEGATVHSTVRLSCE